jgi:hypothetical protein
MFAWSQKTYWTLQIIFTGQWGFEIKAFNCFYSIDFVILNQGLRLLNPIISLGNIKVFRNWTWYLGSWKLSSVAVTNSEVVTVCPVKYFSTWPQTLIKKVIVKITFKNKSKTVRKQVPCFFIVKFVPFEVYEKTDKWFWWTIYYNWECCVAIIIFIRYNLCYWLSEIFHLSVKQFFNRSA